MNPYDHKGWFDCTKLMCKDVKLINHYFTLVRYRAKDVPERCICYVPTRFDDILLYYPMVKVTNVRTLSVFTTFSAIVHDTESVNVNKYVYVLQFCFTESLCTPIFVDVDYGIYDGVILDYINNLKSSLL